MTVYERADRVGGLLMYGIPNMKLSKKTVDRRVDLLREEGIEFVDKRRHWREQQRWRRRHRKARGVEPEAAVSQQGGKPRKQLRDVISAAGKDVVVTGTDCIGTSMRHRCKSIVNFEMLPARPLPGPENNPWPEWPRETGTLEPKAGSEKEWPCQLAILSMGWLHSPRVAHCQQAWP